MDSNDVAFDATLRGFMAGQVILTRYTLLRALGRGGMGVVWLARDNTLKREVALKFLPEMVAHDPEAIDDLKRETRRNLELTHPNIVRIYDFVSDESTAAIAMEYIDGKSLANLRLDKSGCVFSAEELKKWIHECVAAVEYAHDSAKVVHRDLKPANFMVNREGTLKVLDFGIAASISASVIRVSNSRVSGTLSYMSPQQLLGREASAADDWYSVGATLYELLTGRPPFYAGDIVTQIREKVPDSVNAQRLIANLTPIPEMWESTIAACLAKEPRDRPQTGAELVEMLNRGARPTGKTSGPPLPPKPPNEKSPKPIPMSIRLNPQPSQRRQAWWIAGTVIVAALGIGYQLGRDRFWRNPQSTPRLEQPHAHESKNAILGESERGVGGDTKPNKTARLPAASKLSRPEIGADWVVPELDLAMVAIAPGSFMMGSPASEPGRFENEVLHPVKLTGAYWLGKYEMTQAQYERVMGTNPSYFKNVGNDAPVENLSWEEAMDFCRKLNERERKAGRLPEGYAYTLPSEAQREYASRAGGAEALSENLVTVGWYKLNSGDTTHPVGQKEANPWGLHDMYGNVWEWCRDWYADYPREAVVDPEGPSSGTERVNRGGGWESVARSCRPAVRHYSLGPGFRSNFIGFRLALSPVAAIDPSDRRIEK